jgi:hypothetical protein
MNNDGIEVPGCIRVCPAGDICQTVELVDKNNDPIPYEEVWMIFSAECAEMINWCEGQPHPVVAAITDADGIATFCIQAGGCCVSHYAPCDNGVGGSNTVIIEVDELGLIGSYSDVGSPDMHSDENTGQPWGKGDGDVDLNDFVRLWQIFLTDCPCGDLHTCDYDIDLNELDKDLADQRTYPFSHLLITWMRLHRSGQRTRMSGESLGEEQIPTRPIDAGNFRVPETVAVVPSVEPGPFLPCMKHYLRPPW